MVMLSMSAISMMKMTASSSSRSPRRLGGIRPPLWTALILLLMTIPLACTTPEPEGQVIDMEAMRTFKPFALEGLDGQRHALDEYLNRITLVSFFFPT